MSSPNLRTTDFGTPDFTGHPSRVRWNMLALMLLVSLVTYLDRVNISIATRYITTNYGLTDVEMGRVFSAFILAYGLFQVPGGWLGDRFGPRVVMTGAILWWSLFTALTAVLPGIGLLSPVSMLMIARFALGMGEAAAWPNFNRTIANWIPARERAFASSLPLTGGSLGAAITPPVIALAMTTLGWRESFYVCAVAGGAVAALWYIYVRDRPELHASVNPGELAIIRESTLPPSLVSASKEPTPWRVIASQRNVWLLFLSAASCGYLVYIYMTWFYTYLVEARHLTIMQGSFYTVGPFLAMTLMTPLGGALGDKLVRRAGKTWARRTVAMTGMAASGLTLFLGAYVDNINVAIFWLSLGAGSIYFALTAHWATTIDISKEHAGTVSGVMNWGGNMGGMISPILTPILAKTLGWTPALDLAAVISIAGSGLWLLIQPEVPLPRRALCADLRIAIEQRGPDLPV